MPTPPAAPVDRRAVFISYARDDDEAFAHRLSDHLAEAGFNVWWDREAMESRGHTFLREIKDAIAAADRLVLIVGRRARHKPYVEVEWRHAVREGVVVTPLLRDGEYEDVPVALQALHCEDVRPAIPEAEALARVRRLLATPVPTLGPLVGVPRLPTPYLERSERLDHLRSRVLIDAYEPIDLQPDQRITSLTGMGGVGKTILAAALAQAPDVRRSFQDGVHWIAVGREAETLPTLIRMGLALGDADVDRYTGVAEARLLLAKALAARNCLVVLDDVWDVGVAEALHTASGKNVRILLTARKRKLFASAGVHEVPVDELTDEEALDLLAGWTDVSRGALPPEAALIADECGNLPLALAMVGAMIRGRGDRWRLALERMRRADLSKIERKLPDYAYETLERAMLVSFEDLDERRQQRYVDLSAVPEDVAAPGAMLRAWWTAEGMDELDAAEVLDDLADRSLLRRDEDRYMLHDVQRDFLGMRVGDERALHERWLAAFDPSGSEGWATAHDDGYLFDHLQHHLRHAQREADWRALLASFAWIERKTAVRRFPAVLVDLAAYAGDAVLGPLHRACRRAAHVLTNDPGQLAAQLLAQLDVAASSPALARVLEGARARRNGPWLRPLTASLADNGEPTLAVFRGREKDGHAGTPRSVALSADGSLVASGGGSSNDLTIKVWSASTATLLRTYAEAVTAGGSTALAFVAADGRLAGASHEDVRVYALDSDEPVARRTFDRARIARISADRRAGVVFVGLDDGGVLAWDSVNDAMAVLREPTGAAVLALMHASAAPRLAILTDSLVECRDARDGRLIRQLEVELGPWTGSQGPPLAIAPNGSRVFLGNPPRAWTVDEGEIVPLPWDTEHGLVAALSENGAVAVAQPRAHELVVVDLAAGRPTSRVTNSREFSCLALSRDGHVLATGDYEHDVKLWDLTRPDAEPPAWRQRGRVASVAVCDDPGVAVVRAEGERQELWDTARGTAMQEPGAVAADRLRRRGELVFDPASARQVRAQLEATLVAKKPEARLRHEIPVGALAFSRTAGRAVSAPAPRGKGADMEERPPEPGEKTAGTVHLWDLTDLRKPRLLHGHTRSISCVDMTADGRRALTGSTGRLLRLWDLDSGACLRVLRGHRGIVSACALTDDARLAVSGSEDMTVRLWDLVEGKLVFTFAASSWVTACDIARDGAVAIAGETSGRVHTFVVS